MTKKGKPPARAGGTPSWPTGNNRRSLFRGRETRRAWAYALTDPLSISQADLTAWHQHQDRVDFLLRSIVAMFRVRHDPHVGKYAREAVRAAFHALAAFDPEAPDQGSGAFEARFYRFGMEKNALAAETRRRQPIVASLAPRRLTAKQERVKIELDRDVAAGLPEDGRQGRIIAATGFPQSTVSTALKALAKRKAR